MKRPGKRWLWLIPCVLALAVGLFLLLRSRAASLSAPAPSAALLQASDGLDEIVLQAEFLPESRSLRVTQRMALTSRVDDARDTLVLRTWPNAYQSMETSPLTLTELYDAAYPKGFSTGALVMEEATVAHGDGAAEKVFYRYTDTAKTVLSLPLAQSWGCGETLTVTLRYTLMLPKAASRYGVMDGVYAVGNAFPLPALYENGAYRTDDYSPIGDPFVSECANFSLELTLPDGYQCAATSFPSETRQDGERQVMTISAPAVRDFALVLSQQFQAVQAMEGIDYVSFGLGEGNRIHAANMHPDWRHFDVICDGKYYCHLDMGVLGRHNAMNALAASAAAWMMGVPGETVSKGIQSFHGAGRRMEFKGKFNGADVYDDYAHHPDELRATLEAVRSMGYKRVVLAFQPHTYSRTKALFDDFVRELKKSDVVVLAEIYAARERNTIGISSAQLAEQIPGAVYCETLPDVTAYLRENVREGDIVVTMGAGDIFRAGEALISGE